MLNAAHLISSGGLELLGLFLFAEVGLFLGFFLPGDTLLIAAGILAKQGKMSLAGILVIAALAAIAGDNTAYLIGNRVGRKIFNKKNSLLLAPSHVDKAEKFYERYGPFAVMSAHFLPVVRTITPLVAGVGSMRYKTFVVFNAAGDILWAVIVTLLGYYVGSRIPNVDHYILIAVIAVIILSITPTLIQYFRLRSKQKSNTDQ